MRLAASGARWCLTALGVLIAVVLILAMSGCGSSPGPAACKAAMRADYAHALAHPDAAPATKPAACDGLTTAELTRLAGQVLAGR